MRPVHRPPCVRRPRTTCRLLSLVCGLLGLTLAACGGGEGEPSDTGSPGTSEPPSGTGSDPDATVPTDPDATGDTRPSGSPPALPVCGDVLVQTVDAAPWATARTGVSTYRYAADPLQGIAHIDLHDADGLLLGRLSSSQRFGEEGVPDGAMVGTLEVDGVERARLITTGRDVSATGYRVQATLEGTAGTLLVDADFRARRCWTGVDTDAGPPCGAPLSLNAGPFLLPSCGVILEAELHDGRAPTLHQLTYAVADPGGEPGDGEGLAMRDGVALRTFSAVVDGRAADEAALAGWAAGVPLLDDDALRLLATAWLDRRWWRAIEHHVAHCGVAALPPIDGEDVPAGTIRKRCPGTQDNGAWGNPSSGQRSSVWGDPHIVSLDGLAYDLQTTGEVVLLRAIDGEPFEVQGRFEALEDPVVPACGGVSWNTAGATILAGHRVTVTTRPAFGLAIDGVPVRRAVDLPDLPDGAAIDLGPGRVTLTWPGGERVTFQTRSDIAVVGRSLTVDIHLPEHRRGQVRGILGTFDGSTDSDLVLPDGTLLPQPADFETLHGRFADAWRVTSDTTLHDHADGEGPDTFHLPGFPAGPVRHLDLPADRLEAARTRCAEDGITHPHLLDTCAFDAVCLDDPRQGELSADAPLPVAVLPPGRSDLRLSGALALHDPRLPLDTTAVPDPGTCTAWAPPPIAVVPEADDLALAEDLNVYLGTPGTADAQRPGPTTTLAAGTRVTVHALLRPAPANSELRQRGTLRTDRPILGVVLDDDHQPLDSLLESSASAWNVSGIRGLHHALDTLSLSDDRRTLTVALAGADPQRLRVLVEAP